MDTGISLHAGMNRGGLMLEYLKVKNYQIHEDLDVNFTPNLNVFVGASDRGKSAALRALLWVFTNRPLGDDFRTWDSKETRVEVGVDGRKIIRFKSDTENYYQIDDKKFDAPGTEVPKEVLDLINISDVNIQRQGDSYFLISASSGEVGKYINQIIGLEVMDGSIKYASQKVKSIKSDLKVSKFDFKNTKSELAKYKWIDKADKDLQDLEKMQIQLNEITIKCDALTNLIDDHEKYSLEMDKFKKLPEAKKDINGLMALYSTYQSKMQLVNKLTSLIEEYNYAVEDKEDCDAFLKHSGTVEKLFKLYSQYTEKETKRKMLKGLIDEHQSLNLRKKQIEIDIKTTEKEFHKLMPNICPLCGK